MNMEQVRAELFRRLSYADFLGLTHSVGLEGVREAMENFEKGLAQVEEIKKVENVLAVRLIKTPDDLIVWLYTEPEFGAAINLSCPFFSEWDYLPHYSKIPTIAKVRENSLFRGSSP